MRAILARIGTCLALAAGPALAQDSFEARLAALEARPGVTVEVRQENGAEVREIKLPVGDRQVWLTVERFPQGPRINGTDASAHGAVLCAWHLYIGIAHFLEFCAMEQDRAVHAELVDGIGRINAFIAANSLHPTTLEAVEAAAERFAEGRAEAAKIPADRRQQTCVPRAAPDSLLGIVNRARGLSREEIRARIDDLIAVPRPPLMNPCF